MCGNRRRGLVDRASSAGNGLLTNTAVQHTTKLVIIDKCVSALSSAGRSDVTSVSCLCSGVHVCLFVVLAQAELVRDAGCVGRGVNMQLWAV